MVKGAFIYVDKYDSFKDRLSEVSNKQITFIGDKGCIYSHGKYFGGLISGTTLTFGDTSLDLSTLTVAKANNLVGGTKNKIPYQTAADTTRFIDAPSGAADQVLKATYNSTSKSFTLGWSDLEDSWAKTLNTASFSLTDSWKNSGLDMSGLSNGMYALCIQYENVIYTGTFSFHSGDIVTDDEIVLHRCGTSKEYGILFAKIKPNSSNKANLFLACTKQRTANVLNIKIKLIAKL